MSDRTVLRLGSWAAIVGALVALVGNVLHPRMANYDDPVAEEFRIASESDQWVAIHVAILIGALLLIFGLFAVARSMKGGRGEGVARVALGSLLVSAPIGIIGFALDGYVAKAMADGLAGAAPGPASGAAAAAHVGWAVFMALVITFLGITPALFGAAVIADRTYPGWLGWVAVLFGTVAAINGIYGMFSGASAGFFLVFSITSGVLTLWVLALGVLLGRRVNDVVAIDDATERVRARA
jgi:hypothetical protein